MVNNKMCGRFYRSITTSDLIFKSKMKKQIEIKQQQQQKTYQSKSKKKKKRNISLGKFRHVFKRIKSKVQLN